MKNISTDYQLNAHNNTLTYNYHITQPYIIRQYILKKNKFYRTIRVVLIDRLYHKSFIQNYDVIYLLLGIVHGLILTSSNLSFLVISPPAITVKAGAKSRDVIALLYTILFPRI